MSKLGYELSSKNISESYEDLLFREAMAIYCEEESKNILAEDDDFDFAEREKRLREIDSLIAAQKRKKLFAKAGFYAKKTVVAAAVMFLVVAISLSSVVVASADVREYVRESFYGLLYEENNKGYTRVEVAPNDDFIDPELYDWAGAYAPTYMTEGYTFSNIYSMNGQHTVNYGKGDSYISIVQSANGSAKLNTENAELEDIIIGESKGLLARSDDWCCVIWSVGNMMLSVSGTAPVNEIIEVANGIKVIN
ncbi:MAG: DUF4367 domain-containing protein [Oscillospiraceae bacterium]|nr:DUF4367 domain-containing protein [Oscillospiraceae bacterium]